MNSKIKLLLVVGSADSIFVHDYAMWLKRSLDISVDVYELERKSQRVYDEAYYDARYFPTEPLWTKFFPTKVSNQLIPIWKNHQLKSFLKTHSYDIVHCHWIVPSLVLTKSLKCYCPKLFVTFWGGELTHLSLFKSKNIYLNRLKQFMTIVDCIANSSNAIQNILYQFPDYKGKTWIANLGSTSVQYICEMQSSYTKEMAKESLNMPTDKFVVMIGYSGKTLHQHLSIIHALQTHDSLKQRIHLFAPMTRDAEFDYIEKVESALKQSGYTYTLLRDRYLNDREVAIIRLATDIVFQFSTFDGFSRSILECIGAKAWLIYARWLDYDNSLKSWKIQALPAESIVDGVRQLSYFLDHVAEFSSSLRKNSEVVLRKLAWSECIKDWINLYRNA